MLTLFIIRGWECGVIQNDSRSIFVQNNGHDELNFFQFDAHGSAKTEFEAIIVHVLVWSSCEKSPGNGISCLYSCTVVSIVDHHSVCRGIKYKPKSMSIISSGNMVFRWLITAWFMKGLKRFILQCYSMVSVTTFVVCLGIHEFVKVISFSVELVCFVPIFCNMSITLKRRT